MKTFNNTPCGHTPHSKEWGDAMTDDVTEFCDFLRSKYGEEHFNKHACLLFGVTHPVPGGEHCKIAGYINGPLVAGVSALCIHSTAWSGWRAHKHRYSESVKQMLYSVASMLQTMDTSGEDNLEILPTHK